MQKIINFIKQNIQLHQTWLLSLILGIGVIFYDLNISFLEIFVTFFTVIWLDLVITSYNKWKWVFPFSWVNAGFWISFFLRSDEILIYVFAWFLAIFSKYLFTSGWKHFFNPSNFGVFVSLIIFPSIAWTNPLQWWQSVELQTYIFALIMILTFWFFIVSRLIKILNYKFYDLIIAFVIAHLVLYFSITQESGVSSFYLFFNASFLVFIFFMITDPKTNALTRSSRILYAISTALMFYVLQFYINENYSLLGSLFCMTMCLPLIWKLEKKSVVLCNIKFNLSIVFLLFFITFLLLYMCFMVMLEGKVDLLFDNRCNQIMCK